MNTPLSTFQRLAERLPDVFDVVNTIEGGECVLRCEGIELITFNAEGNIVKGSSDGADWLLEKLEMEYEIVKSVCSDDSFRVYRFGSWRIRFWSVSGHDEYCAPTMLTLTDRTKLGLLNEALPYIIAYYLDGEKAQNG